MLACKIEGYCYCHVTLLFLRINLLIVTYISPDVWDDQIYWLNCHFHIHLEFSQSKPDIRGVNIKKSYVWMKILNLSRALITIMLFIKNNNFCIYYIRFSSTVLCICWRLVLGKYSELMDGDANHARRKVLAGIVMTCGELTNAKVISVGTGTKCVGGDHLSVHGASLNDSHAEIVARRGLCVYLYSQLAMHSNPGNACVIFRSLVCITLTTNAFT